MKFSKSNEELEVIENSQRYERKLNWQDWWWSRSYVMDFRSETCISLHRKSSSIYTHFECGIWSCWKIYLYWNSMEQSPRSVLQLLEIIFVFIAIVWDVFISSSLQSREKRRAARVSVFYFDVFSMSCERARVSNYLAIANVDCEPLISVLVIKNKQATTTTTVNVSDKFATTLKWLCSAAILQTKTTS